MKNLGTVCWVWGYVSQGSVAHTISFWSERIEGTLSLCGPDLRRVLCMEKRRTGRALTVWIRIKASTNCKE